MHCTGKIDFVDVTMRYQNNLPPALENLSFTIEPS
jgi:ABC-type bacteriocin/lantibiotic exporter with double-glycine peptidase domain